MHAPLDLEDACEAKAHSAVRNDQRAWLQKYAPFCPGLSYIIFGLGDVAELSQILVNERSGSQLAAE
jgi:hypothetical protein